MSNPLRFLPVAIVGLGLLAGCSSPNPNRIILMPVAGRMMVNALVPQQNRQIFGLGIPETIGSAEQMWLVNHTEAEIVWDVDERKGRVSTAWAQEGNIRYALELTPAEEYVDLVMTIRNVSATTWHDVFAFNCVSPAKAPAFHDSTLLRTYMSVDGDATPLADVPRTLGPRPTVAVYPTRSHAGRLPPFAEAFEAASPVWSDDSWLVVVSEAGDAHMATTAADASFLFANTAFGCIHAAPAFGDLAPHEEATVHTRVFFAKGGLGDFLERYETYRTRGPE
ncbi:MAG: hypothetical protein OEN01_02625 [Candidatus Krumholzibacteria bacterium]|nr:hypothetical protein [Candidatus Krumholzibacteria bacterium]